MEKQKRRTPRKAEKGNEGCLPNLPKTDKIIGIVCADLHLCIKAPIWRSNESDWMGAMRQTLLQLCRLQEELNVPVLIAGDIFDRWNSPPELINFAMKYLPEEIHAIPGQHDLPLHNYENIDKSAYWTLERAGTLNNLYAKKTLWISEILSVTGFPYGFPLEPADTTFNGLKVALVHEYKWIEGCGYSGAPEKKKLGRKIAGVDENRKWYGYDVVVFGDNHQGFLHRIENTIIFNCGSLMRRHSDQKDYKPMVGLLTKEGNVLPHYLDISNEKHLEKMEGKDVRETIDTEEFFEELQKLGDSSLDFFQAIKRFLSTSDVKAKVKDIINELLET